MHIEFDPYENLAMAIQPRLSPHLYNEKSEKAVAVEEVNEVFQKHFGYPILESLLPNPQMVKHFYSGQRWKRVLNEEELKVLAARFGLDSNLPKELKFKRPHSLAKVAAVLGYSREEIRQLENQAIKKLRSFFAEIIKEEIKKEALPSATEDRSYIKMMESFS